MVGDRFKNGNLTDPSGNVFAQWVVPVWNDLGGERYHYIYKKHGQVSG